MAAPDTTKFQINYKLSDGTLINLYATSVQELETGLADLAMNASNIRATGLEISGGVAPAAPAPTVAAVAAAFNATPISSAPSAQAAAPAGANPTCRHGEMALRTGTSARGPWKGWMCAAPKGATDKCETIWVR